MGGPGTGEVAVKYLLTMAALVLGSGPAWSQATVRPGGAWEVPCPFDASKALLPVTCGRLEVPENPERPGRVVEIAFMVVRAPRTLDRHGPLVLLNGGPGEVSLHFAEQPQLVFTGELDASSSGSAGYDIAKLNANARHVVFLNGMHGQFPTELATPEDSEYRMCALQLARAFLADPRRRLDAGCAETRQLRLVR